MFLLINMCYALSYCVIFRLLEIEEAAASVGPKDTTSTFGDGAATTAVEDGVTTIDNVQSPVQEFAVQPYVTVFTLLHAFWLIY